MLATAEMHVRHAPRSSGLHLVQKVGAYIGLLSPSNCPCDDFIVAGCGKDFDWPSQKLNEKLELVRKQDRDLVATARQLF